MRWPVGQSDENLLYYGDNLALLKRHVPDASVDLIYLDPPFNSKLDYNVLFREAGGQTASGQVKAFTDSWRWDDAASEAYATLISGEARAPETLVAAVEA